MTTETSPTASATGDGLMFLIAAAVLVIVALSRAIGTEPPSSRS